MKKTFKDKMEVAQRFHNTLLKVAEEAVELDVYSPEAGQLHAIGISYLNNADKTEIPPIPDFIHRLLKDETETFWNGLYAEFLAKVGYEGFSRSLN